MPAGLDDVASALNNSLQNNSALMASLITALQSIFPQVTSITGGTFTLSAAATTTVLQPLTKANSIIVPVPTNAAAGTLMGGTKSLFVSARTADTSFAVRTASAVAAAGTETFLYLMVNL